MNRPIRALILAEACNPEWASVPLVGWSMAKAIADHPAVDAHVVTQVRNRGAIARTGWTEGEQFTAIDTESTAAKLDKLGTLLRGGSGKGWTTVTALSTLGYYHFEAEVWKRFGPRLRRGEFDVVQRVTPVSPTTPSLLASHCRRVGVPFVLGPLNGGIAWPRGFERTRWQEREWLSHLRGLHKLMYGYRSTRRDSAAILVGSQATFEQVPSSYRSKCFYMPENAIDPRRFSPPPAKRPGMPVRAVFVGRLVPYKGADMLIEAAAPLIRDRRLELTIVGDGPQRASLEQQRDRLGVRGAIEMTGWVPHAEVSRHMAKADIFTLPSVREFGGAVVLEAMASALPPVVINYGGPGELVTPRTGWAVPMSSRENVVRSFREALEEAASHPERIVEKSKHCLNRAYGQFTWSAKADQIVDVYNWVRGQASRPTFAMPTPDAPADLPAFAPETLRLTA